MDTYLKLCQVPSKDQVKCATRNFHDYTLTWWLHTPLNNFYMSWSKMKKTMRREFVPSTYMECLQRQLENTIQGSKSLDEYFMETKKALQRAGLDDPIWMKFHFMMGLTTTSPRLSSPTTVINPYLTEVLQHPQSIEMREGMLHIREVEGPKKTGSVETRLEGMGQQVFKCQGKVESGLNINHMMITEFTSKHRIDANDIGKHLSRLYDRIDQLQGQIYDLQNQNCYIYDDASILDNFVPPLDKTMAMVEDDAPPIWYHHDEDDPSWSFPPHLHHMTGMKKVT
ncbi:40S ribosomal protein S5-1 [Hordeum vulgare]|nr:40S ribosomal protein S5-1 [Hordeum vulgare]